MTTIDLYKYRDGDEIIVSPEKPDEETEYEEMYRLVADEGKMLTNDNINWYYVIDVDSVDGWIEEPHVEPEPEPEP